MKQLKIIILAAGKGIRMKSSTPKVLHSLCGKPMIQYLLDLSNSISSQKITIVLGHKSDAVRQYLKKDISIVLQKKLLGTADAVRRTSSRFRGYHGDVLIICGDTPLLTKETIRALMRRHKSSKVACTVLTAVVANPKGYGRVIRNSRGLVCAIREEKDASKKEKSIREINTGIYCFRAVELFKTIKSIKRNRKKGEYYLTDIIALLAESKEKIGSLKLKDPVEGLGINTRQDLAYAEEVIRKRVLRDLMLKGITVIDPSSTFVAIDAQIGRDTTIRPFTVIENNVRIGKKCLLGPFCRIRPGTCIGNNVEVGNFTEVSRTKIADNCFMKHFSFLGDATLGRRVNIGAGVVTANYDGFRKNSTLIADDAFIGSDSILVAPLSIGKKSVTGAGCVVTKGQRIPKGSVLVGVPARIITRRRMP